MLTSLPAHGSYIYKLLLYTDAIHVVGLDNSEHGMTSGAFLRQDADHARPSRYFELEDPLITVVNEELKSIFLTPPERNT